MDARQGDVHGNHHSRNHKGLRLFLFGGGFTEYGGKARGVRELFTDLDIKRHLHQKSSRKSRHVFIKTRMLPQDGVSQ